MIDPNATETDEEKCAVAVSATAAWVVTARLATVLWIPPLVGGATGVVGAALGVAVADATTEAADVTGAGAEVAPRDEATA